MCPNSHGPCLPEPGDLSTRPESFFPRYQDTIGGESSSLYLFRGGNSSSSPERMRTLFMTSCFQLVSFIFFKSLWVHIFFLLSPLLAYSVCIAFNFFVGLQFLLVNILLFLFSGLFSLYRSEFYRVAPWQFLDTLVENFHSPSSILSPSCNKLCLFIKVLAIIKFERQLPLNGILNCV